MDLSCSRLSPGAELSISSFIAARHPSESCGTNGLPLTPNSIAIYGQSKVLETLSHPNLVVFLECLREKHERIITVQEYYKRSLKDRDHGEESDDFLCNLAKQILEGLEYLHGHNIVHATLEPDNILFDDLEDRVKLHNFGLGHMTHYGSYVAFPIFNPRFAAPEVISQGAPDSPGQIVRAEMEAEGESPRSTDPNFDNLNQIPDAPKPSYDPKCDIWSLGMILACRALKMPCPWPNLKIPQILRKILSLEDSQADPLTRIVREHDRQEALSAISPKLKGLIEMCLQPSLTKRPSAKEILKSVFDYDCSGKPPIQPTFPCLRLRCQDLTWPPDGEEEGDEEPLDLLTIQETYYLWKLAGGDILGELRKHGLMVTMPPVLLVPKLILGEGHLEGQKKERSTLYDPVVIPLSKKQLETCVKEIPVEDCYPLILTEDSEEMTREVVVSDETANLPLVIKEGDVRYQFKRIILYRRLLQCYPFHRPKIWQEARIDSLPLYRAYIWAALLGIEHDTQAHYQAIDKESWTPTDRQIEVDIPRCHQYSNLLASPEGHRKFKRVLKAWVATNPQYVYWQGLDSLCAPFLYLNFNDEALAFACMSAFIPKYLYGMFQKDNAAVIQEYLAKFSHIQAFHDPELFNQLDGIGFIPDLYAIPWILTMFAHVFPLQNIFHLWDKLLLGNSAFPLCIGLAVLYQLRERLLAAEFNDCILLFSDLPAIDIEKCVKDSIQIFCTTPKSLTYRKFGSPPQKEQPRSSSTPVEEQIGDMSVKSVTLKQQKTEKVPRMSGDELKNLLSVDQRDRKSRVLVVDIRTVEEYKLGTLPGSVHIPSSSAFTAEGQLANPDTGEKLTSGKKGKVICVVGAQKSGDDAREFAEKLLSLKFSRLCILHNGIDVFRSSSEILHVPHT